MTLLTLIHQLLLALFSLLCYFAARNLIARDDKFAMLLLCWNGQKESPVHDHPGHGCWMRVVEGSLEETRYHVDAESNALVESGRVIGEAGDCIFIDDSIGVHRVRNLAPTVSMSLHVYSPPILRCNVWMDEKAPADKVQRPVVTFHSEYGTLVTYEDSSALCCDEKR